MDLLIFDFDGTLADSEELLTGLVLRTLHETGLSRPRHRRHRQTDRPAVGAGSGAGERPAAARLDEVATLYRRLPTRPKWSRASVSSRVSSTLAALTARGNGSRSRPARIARSPRGSWLPSDSTTRSASLSAVTVFDAASRTPKRSSGSWR